VLEAGGVAAGGVAAGGAAAGGLGGVALEVLVLDEVDELLEFWLLSLHAPNARVAAMASAMVNDGFILPPARILRFLGMGCGR
jgi:hypothetical protein